MDFLPEICGPYGPNIHFLPEIYGPYNLYMSFLIENMARKVHK